MPSPNSALSIMDRFLCVVERNYLTGNLQDLMVPEYTNANNNEHEATISTGVVVIRNGTVGNINSTMTGTTRPSKLQSLKLGSNFFTGTIPAELGATLRGPLAVLSLSNNRLVGTVPKESMGSLSHLRRLDLSGNAFIGTIPDDIFLQLSQLHDLDVSGNLFSGTLFGDNIPVDTIMDRLLAAAQGGGNDEYPNADHHLGQQSLTQRFDFSSNNFGGSLPTEIGVIFSTYYSNVTHLNFGSNRLTGTIPSEIGLLSSTLQYLDLSSNQLDDNNNNDLHQRILKLLPNLKVLRL